MASNDRIIFELDLRDNNSAKTLGELKKELKDLRKEIDGVQVGSDAFKTLEAKIQSANVEVKEINKNLRGLSPEQTMRGFFAFAEGISGAFSIATGALSLFGTESKAVQEAEKESLAALNLLLGIHSVAQSVDNAAKLVALAQSKLFIVQKSLETAAEEKNIVVKYASIAASKALSAVLKADPILLVIGAILAAATAMITFALNTDRAASAQAAFNKTLSDNAKFDEVFLENLKKNSETTLKDYDRRIELAKAQGKTEKEVNAIILQKLEYEKFLNEAALKRIKSADEANNLTQKGLDIQNEIDKLEGKQGVKNAEAQKKAAEDALKAKEKELDIERKRIELQNQIDNSNASKQGEDVAFKSKIAGIEKLAQFDIERTGLTEQEKKNIITAANIEIDNLKSEFAKTEEDRLNDLDEKYQESTQKKIVAARAELDAKSELNILNATNDDALVAAQIAAIKDKLDFDLKYTDKTETEKLLLKKKAELEIQKLQKESVQQKLAGDAAVLGSLANVAGAASGIAKKGSAEAKALALFQIELATASAIAKGVAAAQDVGYPANILAVASTIAEILGYIGQAKAILSDAQGLAYGGLFESDGRGSLVRGRGTSTSDSINARLSDGEYVVNARATSMFFPLIDYLNRIGNGFASGGLFPVPITPPSTAIPLINTSSPQLERIEVLLAANLERTPIVKTYVSERDMTTTQKIVKKIQDGSKF